MNCWPTCNARPRSAPRRPNSREPPTLAGIATDTSAVARRSPFFTDHNFLNPTNDHLVPLGVSNNDRQNPTTITVPNSIAFHLTFFSAASTTGRLWKDAPAAEDMSMAGHAAADTRLIEKLTLRNVLSFGPDAVSLPLENLNVLIGPNGSGKSNLIEALALLRSSTTDFRPVISRGGGVSEWIWKGNPHDSASIEAVLSNPNDTRPLRHEVTFRQDKQLFLLEEERIEHQDAGENNSGTIVYQSRNGRRVATSPKKGVRTHSNSASTHDPALSVLADNVSMPPGAGFLATAYAQIRLYREWVFGRRNTALRDPQRADLRTDRLEEDFSNLGMFLSRLRRSPRTRKALLAEFRNLYEGLTDFDVSIEGGTVQVFFAEGEFIIPATRLSDGSVRYLCLLTILCDPAPPPLIAIEEPELGLHPDLLPKIADLLISAAERTQLIVTTHSDILVDALTEHPNAVVICEKHQGQSVMRRLDPADLAQWLQKYRLGALWLRGQLGGARW